MGRRQVERLTRPGNKKDGLHSAPSLHGSCPSGGRGSLPPSLGASSPLWGSWEDKGTEGPGLLTVLGRRGVAVLRMFHHVL